MSSNIEWTIGDLTNWWRRPLPRTLYRQVGAKVCPAAHGRWACTRPLGHGGRHVAATSLLEVCAVWRCAS